MYVCIFLVQMMELMFFYGKELLDNPASIQF